MSVLHPQEQPLEPRWFVIFSLLLAALAACVAVTPASWVHSLVTEVLR